VTGSVDRRRRAAPVRARTARFLVGFLVLWAPALLHAAIDSFTLVVLPAAALEVFPPLVIGCSLVVPLLFPSRPAVPSRKDVLR
jgi:hypothetical protein